MLEILNLTFPFFNTLFGVISTKVFAFLGFQAIPFFYLLNGHFLLLMSLLIIIQHIDELFVPKKP